VLENVNISIDWRPVCVHIAWTQTGRHSILKCSLLWQCVRSYAPVCVSLFATSCIYTLKFK